MINWINIKILYLTLVIKKYKIYHIKDIEKGDLSMNIPKKLAIKNVKNNKKRSITTVIGIVIAIVFIYLILTLIVSFNISTEKMAKTTAGDYHIRYYGVSLENVNTLKSYTKSADIDKIGIT